MGALAFIVWGAMIYWSYYVGKNRGRPGLGVLLGFTLGIVGVGIMALIPAKPVNQIEGGQK
jgi:hypothetical protein